MGLEHPAITETLRTGYPTLVVDNSDNRDIHEDIDEVIDDIQYELKACKDRLEHFTEKLESETDINKRFWYMGTIEAEKTAYQALKYVLQSAEQNKRHAG